ncbi:nucleoid-associated protein [Thauera sinica]|uniref:Nucleoid-associated protein n=1 Tax=Thauera sinica TaxID=2665146 RepID=A0ABW1AXS0_9RHOO|nr:nucleoid-associated protein [Thauera sp. K11]ATE58651.1 nucleoid-associated protein [Thauera sp. K11]
MSAVHHAVTHLVVHRLIKEANAPATVSLRPAPCPLDAAAVRLVERMCRQYAERSAKGFGRFEEDGEQFPLARWLREHVVEQSMDFIALSHRMAERLQAIADEEELDSGGFVVVARVREGEADCLWAALIGEAAGTGVSGALDVLDCAHLDFSALQAAGRVDLGGWQRGDERYLGFLRGRGRAGGWFKRFLGCSDVVVALQETKKLVMTLGRFVEEQHLEPAARDALLERAHGYLDALGESGEAVVFDELAREVFPEQPARLDAMLNAAEAKLADGFVPNRRAIRPLVRFSASGEQWKLEFDRSGLHSGAVHYDRATDTLVLSGVPEYLKRMLAEEAP